MPTRLARLVDELLRTTTIAHVRAEFRLEHGVKLHVVRT
jgi:hypothetical protein